MFGNKKGKFEITVEETNIIPCYTGEAQKPTGYSISLKNTFNFRVSPGTKKITCHKMYHNRPIDSDGIELSLIIYVAQNNGIQTCVFIIDGRFEQNDFKTYAVKNIQMISGIN